jgi:hypothetical protein
MAIEGDARAASIWDISTAESFKYSQDKKEGEFVPDIAFLLNKTPVLFIEVAFSQPLADISNKVKRMLKSLNGPGGEVLGVLVILIEEATHYRRPPLCHRPRDMTITQWEQACGHPSFLNNRLQPVTMFGHTWVKETSIQFHYFPGDWTIGADYGWVRFPFTWG